MQGLRSGVGLAAALALFVLGSGAAWSCSPFGASPPEALDGGAPDGPGPVTARDVRVEPGWPSVVALDPAQDARAGTIRISVTDSVDPTRSNERELKAAERVPQVFAQFASGALVDVVIEVVGTDGRLLGYGERRRWDLRSSLTVRVAVRRRILYASSTDHQSGELHAYGMTPSGLAEPGMDEPYGLLPSLSDPTALLVTGDGTLLVQAGVGRNGPLRQLAILETGSHKLAKTLPVDFVGRMVAIGDSEVLVAPSKDAAAVATVFARVDVASGAVTVVPTGLVGGALVVSSLARSPDGQTIVAVGTYEKSAMNRVPELLTYDVPTGKVSVLDLAGQVDEASGVRFSPDGKTIVVVGHKDAADWGTGQILLYPRALPPAPPTVYSMLAGKTKPTSFIAHPDGIHAFINNETHYFPSGPPCCAEMRIVDLQSGKEVYASAYSAGGAGPEFDIVSAVRLPYGTRRVVGGQSDPGNNVHGKLVELSDGARAPVEIEGQGHTPVGSLDDIATPFGEPL